MLPDQLAANESIHNAGRRNGSSTPVAVAATNPSNSYEFVVCRIIGRDENDIGGKRRCLDSIQIFPRIWWNKNVKDVVTFGFHISNIEMIEIIIIAIFNYRGYFQYFPTNVLVSGITIIYYQLSKNINFVCESIEVKNRIWIFPILSNLVSSDRLLKISRELEIYLKKKYHEFSSTNWVRNRNSSLDTSVSIADSPMDEEIARELTIVRESATIFARH